MGDVVRRPAAPRRHAFATLFPAEGSIDGAFLVHRQGVDRLPERKAAPELFEHLNRDDAGACGAMGNDAVRC